MYGLIGKIKAKPGEGAALIEILLQASGDMPGCLSYIVAADAGDPDAVWVTEVWEDRESHRASLSLPAVQAAIGRGRALIETFEAQYETQPLGGYGLPGAHSV